MAKARSLVGLDVHATKIVAAVLDADTGEVYRTATRPADHTLTSNAKCAKSAYPT